MEKSQRQLLIEKWDKVINIDKEMSSVKRVAEKHHGILAQLIENQQNSLMNENSSTALGDIAQYTPILTPAVRRIFPNTITKDIIGVQPMNGPTGYAFAIRFAYEGAKGKNNLNGNITYPGATNTTLNGNTRIQKPDQSFGGAALVLKGNVPAATGTSNFYVDTTGSATSDATVWGDVVLVQYDPGQNVTKVLVNITATSQDSVTLRTALSGLTLGTSTIILGGAAQTVVASTATLSSNQTSILGYFNNEAGYNLLFGTAYAPYETTASAEYKARADMKSLKMSIERFAVNAETRKYKAEYSLELAQDLKAVQGLDAEAELINILEYEIAAELDRDIVDTIHANSTNAGSWFYGPVGQIQASSTNSTTYSAQTSDGRWELEKFRSLYTRIIREANAVQLQTRRGPANFIIASLNVVSALETLSNFMYSAVPGNIDVQLGVAKVGTLDGRFSVYLDTFAFSDFFIVGYKGNSNMDSGIVYCPYVPLQMIKVTDPNTFQPAIGFQSRDAIMGNMWGIDKYYRKVFCDFTGSSFIQSSYYW